MSENRAEYKVEGRPMISLKDFRHMPCALRFAEAGYSRPTPGEVDALIRAVGWSQSEVAKLVGAHSNDKGSTTIRKWRAPLDSPEYREIPYACWRLMLLAAGVVDRA